jgi:hypothetical protein
LIRARALSGLACGGMLGVMKQAMMVVLPVAVLTWWLAGCGQASNQTAVETLAGTNQATLPAKPEFQKLLGRWERPDGGYVLEFRAVDGVGNLDTGYFNPAPIKVERAAAVVEAGNTKVFIVLRDVNYPGSTYSLTYDAAADQLFGQYFQATQQQTYDVTFGRLKP